MSRTVELRNHPRELQNFQLRLALSAGFVLLLFLLLFARFSYLQVSQREHYHTLAEANRISISPIVPNRGLIFDRNGEVLAHNYSAYTLEIVPSKIGDLEALINELATVVEIAARDR
jgi:penicillin-binding protein 2